MHPAAKGETNSRLTLGRVRYIRDDHNKVIEFGQTSNNDPEQGPYKSDSGGPLVCNDVIEGRAMVFGLLQSAENDFNKLGTADASNNVAAKISSYVDWISDS